MRLIEVGENAVAIIVSGEETADCVSAIDRIYFFLKRQNIPGILSCRRGLDAILLELKEDFDRDELEEVLPAAERDDATSAENPEVLRIPVCYEPPYGRDLSDVARACGLDESRVIELHQSVTYKVWMIGFMPGYAYLGKLDLSLHLKRKSSPDRNVPAGSVAIAEEYVGIYPFDSPGGWHILGRTPLRIVEYKKEKPWLFEYGMPVSFYSIHSNEFEELQRQELVGG